MKIYLGTGHAREAVQILQSDNFGPKSRFAEQDPQLVTALIVEAFEASKAWQEAFTFCRDVLSQQEIDQSVTPDEGKVWMLLVRAAKTTGESQ